MPEQERRDGVAYTDVEAGYFEQPQPRAVEQARHQPGDASRFLWTFGAAFQAAE